MSLNPRLPPSKRKQIIKEYIAFKNVGDKDLNGTIAWMCGVDRKTIQRDIKKMQRSGEWDDFIEATVLKLSQSGDIDDVTKFREWMKIYGKRFAEKHEVGVDLVTETVPTIDWSTLNDEERNKLIDAGRILIRKRSSERKPDSIH